MAKKFEVKVGDVFTNGTTCWRIEEIDGKDIWCSSRRGQRGAFTRHVESFSRYALKAQTRIKEGRGEE